MTATNLAGEGHRPNDNGNYSPNCVPSPSSSQGSDVSAEVPGNMSSSRYPRRRMTLGGAVLVVLSAVLLPLTAAQTTTTSKCISLASSRACPAFNESSISTSNALTSE